MSKWLLSPPFMIAIAAVLLSDLLTLIFVKEPEKRE